VLFELGGRPVGPSAPVFVIAELGLNHGGDLDCALALVDAAADAGATGIKLQTLESDALVAPSCPAPAHLSAASLRDFFVRFELDFEAHRHIVTRARQRGLAVLSTPLSEYAVAMLEPLALDGYKIASGDLTYDGLIAAAARTGRPLVLSTGMGDLDEVLHAVDVAKRAGAKDMAILHCVSAYPTPVDCQNLRAIETLRAATGLPVGLSDHGPGLLSAVAATALGAVIYERHFVLSPEHDAVDRAVSSTPEELEAIVQAVAATRAALGDGVKECLPVELVNRTASRRGVYAARRLRVGDIITEGDIVCLRPANDIAPQHTRALLGATAARDISAGDAIQMIDLCGVHA
jgi:sialic acid synthase SpsE